VSQSAEKQPELCQWVAQVTARENVAVHDRKMSHYFLLLTFAFASCTSAATDDCGASAACQQPIGPIHDLSNPSELQRVLPGRWMLCATNPGFPAGTIGIEFNQDASQWWFLVDDGNGQPKKRDGFDSSGWTNLLVMNGQFTQIDLFNNAQGFYPSGITISDGPPPHMHFDAVGDVGDFIRAPDGCGGALSGPFMGSASTASFGDVCAMNTPVKANTCPSIDGVACSFCAFLGLNMPRPNQCMRPCHRSMNECPQGTTCVVMTEVTVAGACTGFDGYCQ